MTVKTTRRQAICRAAIVIAGALIGGAPPEAASAEAWPSRTITGVAPFAAGSAADVISRVVFNQLSKQFARPIVVENRPGAGGTTGANVVAKSAPDGHTILASGALAAAHAVYRKLPYDTVRDFIPVIPLGSQPLVLVAARSRGFQTLSDMIAFARAKPNGLNFASAGVGSATHFAAERLRLSASVEFQHIPFRGPAAGITELLAGRIDIMFVPAAAGLSLIKDGKVVALAVSSAKRSAMLPSVPTTEEAGFANSAYDFWIGLFVPAHTPSDIVARLHDETAKALEAAAVRTQLNKLGVEPMAMSQRDFVAYFRSEIGKNDNLVAVAKIAKQ